MSGQLQQFLDAVAGGLIVSCQALPGEPLYDQAAMPLFAKAAMVGGARGFRANGGSDIRAFKKLFPLPVIGIVKRSLDDSPVFITPTIREVLEVVEAGADVVAVDATSRPRPGGQSLESFLDEIRSVTQIPVMADVSSVAEAVRAAEVGFDIVATTLVGYSDSGQRREIDEYTPDFEVIKEVIAEVAPLPVIVEGRIWEPDDARRCIELGAHAIVIGSAITRPHLITRRFVNSLAGGARRADVRS